MFVFAQLAIRRGAARVWDHAQLVHQIWEDLLILKAHVFILRVATDDNIGDLPSRLSFSLFERVGAVEVDPLIPEIYGKASTW